MNTEHAGLGILRYTRFKVRTTTAEVLTGPIWLCRAWQGGSVSLKRFHQQLTPQWQFCRFVSEAVSTRATRSAVVGLLPFI